eukprot:8087213-Karenia_brevis.AAC.1
MDVVSRSSKAVLGAQAHPLHPDPHQFVVIAALNNTHFPCQILMMKRAVQLLLKNLAWIHVEILSVTVMMRLVVVILIRKYVLAVLQVNKLRASARGHFARLLADDDVT